MLQDIIPGKAAGWDDRLTEMLQHIDNKEKSWLLDMLNECTRTKHRRYIIYLEESKGDSNTKAWEGPLLPKKLSPNLAAMHSI